MRYKKVVIFITAYISQHRPALSNTLLCVLDCFMYILLAKVTLPVVCGQISITWVYIHSRSSPPHPSPPSPPLSSLLLSFPPPPSLHTSLLMGGTFLILAKTESMSQEVWRRRIRAKSSSEMVGAPPEYLLKCKGVKKNLLDDAHTTCYSTRISTTD